MCSVSCALQRREGLFQLLFVVGREPVLGHGEHDLLFVVHVVGEQVEIHAQVVDQRTDGAEVAILDQRQPVGGALKVTLSA